MNSDEPRVVSQAKRVRIAAQWESKYPYWWTGRLGEEIVVQDYSSMATRGGTLDYCQCSECCNQRRGEKLYKMYEVASGEKAGSIIPVEVCVDV